MGLDRLRVQWEPSDMGHGSVVGVPLLAITDAVESVAKSGAESFVARSGLDKFLRSL